MYRNAIDNESAGLVLWSGNRHRLAQSHGLMPCCLARPRSSNPFGGGFQIRGFVAGVRDQRLGDIAPDQPLPHAGQRRRPIEEVEGHRLAANEGEDPRLSRFRLQLAQTILDLWPASLLDIRVREGVRVDAEASD